MRIQGRAQYHPRAIVLQDVYIHGLCPPPFRLVSHFCRQWKATDCQQGKSISRTRKRKPHSWKIATPPEAATSLQFFTAALPATTGNGLHFNFLAGLHKRSFAGTLHQATPLQHKIVKFLCQPLGGTPVAVVEGVPGWQTKVVQGPRRWLGLRPGRALPIADAGPWWTPSGLLHLLQNVPTAIWLAALLWLGCKGVQMIRSRLKMRGHRKEQQALISAAKASDLLLQRDRMLRAFRGAEEEAPQEEDEEGEPAALASDPQWQDPLEWDPATRRQWEDFMRKSKAMRIQQERWWDIGAKDDTPHYKAAHDRLQDTGQLPDYS